MLSDLTPVLQYHGLKAVLLTPFVSSCLVGYLSRLSPVSVFLLISACPNVEAYCRPGFIVVRNEITTEIITEDHYIPSVIAGNPKWIFSLWDQPNMCITPPNKIVQIIWRIKSTCIQLH